MTDAQVHPFGGGGNPNKGTATGHNSKKDTKDEDLVPEVDEELENGPVFNRHCTDVL